MQEEIIRSALEGRDTLALLPTGGGKSVCFQVPALAMEGICIVISPLVALMKDQVENLNRRDIRARAIYSGMHFKEIDLILQNCMNNDGTRFLYMSPERLRSDKVRNCISQMNVNLLAVDEAHCISQWGYDFRPEYRQLSAIREVLHKKVPVLALTASATRQVIEDIQQQLGFRKPNVFRQSFERTNLAYVIRHPENKDEKLADMITKLKGSGLVYVRNRRKTAEISELLQRNGVQSDHYHAGLPHDLRMEKQTAWLHGHTRVMVCTNAFGMGIDKPDVRFVVHYEIPDSPESYYQEAGRAGRDGHKSWCILFSNNADEAEMEERLKLNFPPEEEIRKTYQALCDYLQVASGAFADRSFDFDLTAFSHRYRIPSATCYAAIKVLEQCGLISLSENFYEPSRVKFTMRENALYAFQVSNSSADEFIKLLLRSYGGMFDNYIAISEQFLGKRLSVSTPEVTRQLKKLDEYGVLEYLPRKDLPQISFTTARTEARYINFEQAGYQARKNMYSERLKAMIQYARNHTICRSRALLEYFDEYGKNDCGICDICLERKSSLNGKTDEICGIVKQHLHQHALTIEELKAKCRSIKEDDLVTAVRFLLDNDKLRYNANMQLCWNEKRNA